jgi:hypothetical protein
MDTSSAAQWHRDGLFNGETNAVEDRIEERRTKRVERTVTGEFEGEAALRQSQTARQRQSLRIVQKCERSQTLPDRCLPRGGYAPSTQAFKAEAAEAHPTQQPVVGSEAQSMGSEETAHSETWCCGSCHPSGNRVLDRGRRGD